MTDDDFTQRATETLQAMPRDVLAASIEANVESMRAVGAMGGMTPVEFAALLMRAAVRYGQDAGLDASDIRALFAESFRNPARIEADGTPRPRH